MKFRKWEIGSGSWGVGVGVGEWEWEFQSGSWGVRVREWELGSGCWAKTSEINICFAEKYGIRNWVIPPYIVGGTKYANSAVLPETFRPETVFLNNYPFHICSVWGLPILSRF